VMSGTVVLVVAAHADDEVLGCGGTVARHTDAGDSVHLLLMADGVTARNGADIEAVQRRGKALREAAEELGIASVSQAGFPDNQLDTVSLLQVTKAVERVLFQLKPECVYTHWYGDLNVDHRVTQKAVMTACRPQPGFPVRRILGFEVLSSTEWCTPQCAAFSPNYFVDISSFINRKNAALGCYDMEMRASPHSRSVKHSEALAVHRGNTVGLVACEAFEVYRWIV
jgi:N-acetylglucosamine malate deacetylase 1